MYFDQAFIGRSERIFYELLANDKKMACRRLRLVYLLFGIFDVLLAGADRHHRNIQHPIPAVVCLRSLLLSCRHDQKIRAPALCCACSSTLHHRLLVDLSLPVSADIGQTSGNPSFDVSFDLPRLLARNWYDRLDPFAHP